MMAVIMRAAARNDGTSEKIVADLRNMVVASVNAPVARPAQDVRLAVKRQHDPGQRELPFFGIVRERREKETQSSTGKAFEIPVDESKVDFGQSLTWFSHLRGRRKTQTNRVAVWLGFMLIAGGLHYKEAAKRLGVTPAAFRTYRTRVGIPSDPDRLKMGAVFDLDAAKATLARSGYELRRCLKSENWFWVKKSDKGVRYSPQFRTGERIIGDIGNKFTILTNAMLEAEKRKRSAPFANSGDRMLA
jgi:hypothetical protein